MRVADFGRWLAFFAFAVGVLVGVSGKVLEGEGRSSYISLSLSLYIYILYIYSHIYVLL